MPYPQLMGAGSINLDTHAVYTTPHLRVGTFGILEGLGYVWCSHSGSEVLTRGEPLVADRIKGITQNVGVDTNAFCVGSHIITDTDPMGAGLAVNEFMDGYAMIVDGAGEGTFYRIRDHAASGASGGYGTLWDPFVIASDADTEVTFLKNKYADVQRSVGGLRRPFVGVPNVEVPAGDTDTQYFWAQRVGYCPVFVSGTPTAGTSVMVSSNMPGRLASVRESIEVEESLDGGGRSYFGLDATPVVGQMVTDAIDGEVQVVDLQNSLF